MTKETITVIGGTGAQGGGVVDALLASGQYAVRVASRDPAGASVEALKKRGVQVLKGDLLDPGSLRAAFEGAHGAFVVTNFWDPTQMQNETEIGSAAVKEARAAGVQHLIVSTLNAQGHGVQVQQVPAAVYDTFFPGVPEIRETFQYFEQCFYFGPEREPRIAAANALYPAGFIDFSEWAKVNLTPASVRG